MNAIIEEITVQQLRSLRWIYGVMGALTLTMLVSAWLLGPASPTFHDSGSLLVEGLLGGLACLLLFVLLPWLRRRMLDSQRVLEADPRTLQRWGLPEGVPPHLGRPAIYLTRYTAGCVLSWGLSAAVALYGLVASMLGARSLVAGLLFSAATFCLLLLPPDGKKLRQLLKKLDSGTA